MVSTHLQPEYKRLMMFLSYCWQHQHIIVRWAVSQVLADAMASPPAPASTALSGVTCVGGVRSEACSKALSSSLPTPFAPSSHVCPHLCCMNGRACLLQAQGNTSSGGSSTNGALGQVGIWYTTSVGSSTQCYQPFHLKLCSKLPDVAYISSL